jgi:hypothetical protein
MADKKPLVLVAGEIEGIDADDAIALIHGGTGANTAAGARITLGLVPGTNVQAFSSELAALAGLATNGIPVRTASGTYTIISLQGTAGNVSVTNGDGVAGNPTVDLSAVANSGSGSFSKFTRDGFGRVT